MSGLTSKDLDWSTFNTWGLVKLYSKNVLLPQKQFTHTGIKMSFLKFKKICGTKQSKSCTLESRLWRHWGRKVPSACVLHTIWAHQEHKRVNAKR